jgi:hypothetical protein
MLSVNPGHQGPEKIAQMDVTGGLNAG